VLLRGDCALLLPLLQTGEDSHEVLVRQTKYAWSGLR
jgi:hypothetical protein